MSLTFTKVIFIILFKALYQTTGSNLSWTKPATVRLVASSRGQGDIIQNKK